MPFCGWYYFLFSTICFLSAQGYNLLFIGARCELDISSIVLPHSYNLHTFSLLTTDHCRFWKLHIWSFHQSCSLPYSLHHNSHVFFKALGSKDVLTVCSIPTSNFTEVDASNLADVDEFIWYFLGDIQQSTGDVCRVPKAPFDSNFLILRNQRLLYVITTINAIVVKRKHSARTFGGKKEEAPSRRQFSTAIYPASGAAHVGRKMFWTKKCANQYESVCLTSNDAYDVQSWIHSEPSLWMGSAWFRGISKAPRTWQRTTRCSTIN